MSHDVGNVPCSGIFLERDRLVGRVLFLAIDLLSEFLCGHAESIDKRSYSLLDLMRTILANVNDVVRRPVVCEYLAIPVVDFAAGRNQADFLDSIFLGKMRHNVTTEPPAVARTRKPALS